MIGLAQSNSVSRATCVPMPWTKTTPVRRAPPGAEPGTAVFRGSSRGGGGGSTLVGSVAGSSVMPSP